MSSTYEALEKRLAYQLACRPIHINSNPFPYFIIDDFLPLDIFEQITSCSLSESSLRKDFLTPIERKQVYGDEDLFGPQKFPIKLLGGIIGKNLISKIINSQSVISMMDSDNYGGYHPFHSMQSGGYLGSHVDHSYSINDDELHIANCIYYVSPQWEENWGGETLLFDKTGLRIIEKILPKPNRLIVFAHSSNSFHGTDRLNCPESKSRNTYYMDFYIPKSEYRTVKAHLKKAFGVDFSIWRHVTCFHPFAPLGIKSFSLKEFFSRTQYFPSFFVYWLVFLFRPLGLVLLLYGTLKKLLKKRQMEIKQS
jgi:hypothetical protein